MVEDPSSFAKNLTFTQPMFFNSSRKKIGCFKVKEIARFNKRSKKKIGLEGFQQGGTSTRINKGTRSEHCHRVAGFKFQ